MRFSIRERTPGHIDALKKLKFHVHNLEKEI